MKPRKTRLKQPSPPRGARNRTSAATRKHYDVCLSFAGEDRPFVDRVARALTAKGLQVFYDKYEQAELWGKDLYTHLDEVYRMRGSFCVIFVSAHYKRKLWTNHERRSAQARAFLENDEYILPVMIDGTQLPGLLPTVGFVRAADYSPGELATMVRGKVDTRRQNARIARTSNTEFRRVLYEGFDFKGLSPSGIAQALAGRWLVGTQNAWFGKVSKGNYVLSNRTRMSASITNLLRYSSPDGTMADLSDGKASVRVRLGPPFSANTGGGLAFRMSPESRTYLAFYRIPGRAVSLCRVVEGKLEVVWTDEILALGDDDFARLTVIGRGDRVELMIDSSVVFVYNEQTIRGPGVGTFALGTGTFEFDDFAMYVRT